MFANTRTGHEQTLCRGESIQPNVLRWHAPQHTHTTFTHRRAATCRRLHTTPPWPSSGTRVCARQADDDNDERFSINKSLELIVVGKTMHCQAFRRFVFVCAPGSVVIFTPHRPSDHHHGEPFAYKCFLERKADIRQWGDTIVQRTHASIEFVRVCYTFPLLMRQMHSHETVFTLTRVVRPQFWN